MELEFNDMVVSCIDQPTDFFTQHLMRLLTTPADGKRWLLHAAAFGYAATAYSDIADICSLTLAPSATTARLRQNVARALCLQYNSMRWRYNANLNKVFDGWKNGMWKNGMLTRGGQYRGRKRAQSLHPEIFRRIKCGMIRFIVVTGCFVPTCQLRRWLYDNDHLAQMHELIVRFWTGSAGQAETFDQQLNDFALVRDVLETLQCVRSHEDILGRLDWHYRLASLIGAVGERLQSSVALAVLFYIDANQQRFKRFTNYKHEMPDALSSVASAGPAQWGDCVVEDAPMVAAPRDAPENRFKIDAVFAAASEVALQPGTTQLYGRQLYDILSLWVAPDNRVNRYKSKARGFAYVLGLMGVEVCGDNGLRETLRARLYDSPGERWEECYLAFCVQNFFAFRLDEVASRAFNSDYCKRVYDYYDRIAASTSTYTRR